MTSHAVTATRTALHGVMDARALNLEQTRLLINTTPECDSLAEYLGRLLGHGVPAGEVADIATLIRRIVQSNVAEGQAELQAGGILDDLARLTRSAELHRDLDRALTVKNIARTLRDPLNVIACPGDHGAMQFVAAVRTVDDVIARCPERQLRSPALRHELRDRAFGLLSRLLDSRLAVAA